MEREQPEFLVVLGEIPTADAVLVVGLG